ncbi:MAG: 16S rRNA (guanine(966)-N(2))-methyltransferase RsmD [Spongiibacteraceae bacterium]
MTKNHNPAANRSSGNQLRIIAGQWRGRKLQFPSVEGLRPTPDRVRETLFNWLAPVLPNARCLDLFAGSGALGLEALSRGAAQVDFIDSSGAAIKQLQQNLQLLKAEHANCWQEPADQWLRASKPTPQPTYDVIFLDPPFHKGLAEHCIKLIDEQRLLAANSYVYLEMGSIEALPPLPPSWQLHREKTAGQVCYRLFTTNSS